ncbi:MAG TPA: hypothetical protein ENJ37_08615 [Deltaproteobacteria bacterium]|nr:hypothetical protein [Deltaproteobacteria bacterium]
MAPGYFETFFGGFAAFFSVWQLCIFQVTPFYIAFMVAARLLSRRGGRGSSGAVLAVTALGLAVSFSLVFGIMGVPHVGVGGVILRNLKLLKLLAGAFIIVSAAVLMLPALRVGVGVRTAAALSPLAGAAFAIGYSPCISPALAAALNFARSPDGGGRGLVLVVLYGAGMAAALTLTGAAFMAAAGWLAARRRTARVPAAGLVAAAAVYMTMGVLLVTGLMLRYKAFLVNFF